MKKFKVIIITGTPGTGKTRFAKKLAKKEKAVHIDVNELIKKEKLYKKYNKSLRTREVDINKLNKRLIKLIKEFKKKKQRIIIDSHLSHYLPKKYVDLCIVKRCDLKTLKKRLEKRKYPKKKIRENIESEILDICLLEAIANKHRVRIINK